MRRLALVIPLLLASRLTRADELPGVAERFVAAFRAMHQAS